MIWFNLENETRIKALLGSLGCSGTIFDVRSSNANEMFLCLLSSVLEKDES